MARGDKRPKKSRKKLEVVPPEINHDESTPRFCLKHLVPGFGVSALDKDGRAALATALEARGSMTWKEIKQAPRHGLGTEWIPADQILATKPQQFHDSDRFMVFRYHGLLPMVGMRSEDTFHVLWLEANFGDVYDHGD